MSANLSNEMTLELALIRNADDRAAEYLRQIGERRVFPSDESLAGLAAFDEALPEHGRDPAERLALLDEKGSPATVATNDPRYFGFVIGATLPAAAAAERLMLSWDQSASLFLGSPVAAKVEKIAANWVLKILDLPRESAVGFGTSATACEQADSWTTDGHKWLNTPYDCAMAICRDADALAGAMNSDAVYSSASPDAQKNLTLEFSRRARGIPVWAALRSLGKAGVAEMVERHCSLARQIAEGLKEAGYTVLNRVVINQVLACAADDDETKAVIKAAQDSGEVWFGASVWHGKAAFRISVSSWRTNESHAERLITLLSQIRSG